MINELNSIGGDLSRNQLLTWVNGLTKSGVSKIEQLGTGVAYCEIIDTIHPKSIPNKGGFKGRSEYEYINNFKLLQQCFTKLGIYKNIEIQKLVKCKYQDNLEFLQWFQKYFQHQVLGIDRQSIISQRKSLMQNRSIHKRSSSFLNSNNISKIEKKGVDVASFQDILDQLPKHNQHQNSFQQLTEFYKSKLRQIELLVNEWDSNKLAREFSQKINQIVLTPPPEVKIDGIEMEVGQ